MTMNLRSFATQTASFAATLTALLTAQAQTNAWDDPALQDAAWTARGCTNDARGQWFRDAKFGAFIHFGLYSELGGYWHGQACDPAEQIMGLGERRQSIPWKQYQQEVGGAFNPANFSAQKWVSLIKAAGQKYLIVTTKHHDGFAMFKTATTSYNVVDSTPFARDIIRELSDECKKQGIVFCLYYSIGDWCAADVMGPQFTGYEDYMHAQLRELLTHYGDIKMLWFDNYWYVNDQWKNDLPHAKRLYAFAHSINPNMLINDRCGRGAASTDGDYATPENQLQGSRRTRYFEVVMTDTGDDNWGWVKTARNYRTPAQLIHNLIDCTSKGGNFVLNVGPTASGEFPPQHVALLQAIGKWTGTNGAAIYGTVPAPECVMEFANGLQAYATKTSADLYIHVTQWPSDGTPAVVQIGRTGLGKVELLDPTLGKVECSSELKNSVTFLKITKPEIVDPYATVLRVALQPAAP